MIPKNGLDIARLRLTVRSSTSGTKSGKRTTSLFLEDVVPQHESVEPREEEAVQGIVGVMTIGSPRMLNDVLTTTGTPVI